MTRVRAAWIRWVAFLGEREGAESLAIARVIAGLTLLHHLFAMTSSGVADAMWVDVRNGGYRGLDEGWLSLFGGATPGAVHALMAVTAVGAILLTVGLFTRAGAFVAWLGFVRLAKLNWQCGGSSDELLTNALFLLMLSGCGEVWSADARRRGGPPREIPAWPRRLLVFQLVLLYFTTALQKVSASWIPFGSMDALWYILQQPTWQKHDMRWLAPFYPATQLATLVTWFFEMGSPLLLLAMWFRRAPVNRPGRVRRVFAAIRFRTSYLALGLFLHLGIWATLEVGPFLGGILTLYAACFAPAEWRASMTQLRKLDFGRLRGSDARMLSFLAAALVFAPPALSAPAPSAPDPLSTHAERSKWTETGRYDEVLALCAKFQETYPDKARCHELARTPEGRPMVALVVSADGLLDPEKIRAAKRPVVLFQGGIHAGEIDGKDAGFWLLREMLQGKAGKGGLLTQVTAVFVPVFNVDGHERFGANNRPNQVGPKEMGWRTTAQNLNLNRDYAKADAPEMRAMLATLRTWDPVVYLDLHVTDGAKFRHGIAYLVEPTTQGAPELTPLAKELRDEVVKKLEKAGHLPIGEFYPSFETDDDPASGFSLYSAPPRFSTSYWANRNRIGVLVETHSWKDYATRVKATRDAILASIEFAAAKGPALLEAAAKADANAAKLGGTPLTLVQQPAGPPKTIEFKGYAYKREPSEISGGTKVVYDERRPEIWKVPLVDKLKPAVTVKLPKAGYIVPAAHAAWMKERLAAHGIQFVEIPAEKPALDVESFRAAETTFGTAPYEGRQTLKAAGAWAKDSQKVPAGSLFVPIAQPASRLVANLLEPMAPDSYLAWGFFNGHFERKEYMEAYVAEDIAKTMLKDPAVKAEFDKKVQSDPVFAKDPAARLDFFYRKHASWDSRHNLYPVYRVDAAP